MHPLRAAPILLLAIVAGCGSGDSVGSPSPAALLASALTATEKTESYRSSFSLRSDLGGERVDASGVLRSNADSTKARGPVRFRQDGEPFAFEMILLDDEVFIRSDALKDALPKGKQWLRSTDPSLAQQSLTPKQFVALLRDTPQVRRVGEARIRGRRTVQLRGPVDLRKAAERIGGGPISDLVRRSPETVDRIKPVVDVWIDREDDSLERMAMTLTMRGEPGRMVIRGDILEPDVSLDDVKAPADDLVVDEKDLETGDGGA
jgi:hypothetical protein